MAIPTITHTGGRGATTELAAGDRPGGTATAATPAQTCTAAGAIPLTPEPGPPGPILIPEIMAAPAGPLFRTRSAAPWAWPAAAPIPTSIAATPSAAVVPRPTIRTPASWLVLAPDMPATCTAVRERLAGAALPTTPILAPESPGALTTFTPAKTVASTAITGRAGVGLRIAATDGSPRPNPKLTCSSNSRPVLWGSNVPRTLAARWVEDPAAAADEGS